MYICDNNLHAKMFGITSFHSPRRSHQPPFPPTQTASTNLPYSTENVPHLATSLLPAHMQRLKLLLLITTIKITTNY